MGVQFDAQCHVMLLAKVKKGRKLDGYGFGLGGKKII